MLKPLNFYSQRCFLAARAPRRRHAPPSAVSFSSINNGRISSLKSSSSLSSSFISSSIARSSFSSMSSRSSSSSSPPPLPTLLDFSDTKTAFKTMTTAQIARALLVFRLCGVRMIVKNADILYSTMSRLFGQRLTNYAMKKTFFGHFCAGEVSDEVQPTLRRLGAAGVGAILDYSAEADVNQAASSSSQGLNKTSLEAFKDRQRASNVVSARTYIYQGEEECDKNLATFIGCIDEAAKAADSHPFVAVKLTAICLPEVLEKVSSVLMSIRKLWRAEFGEHAMTTAVTHDAFDRFLSNIGAQVILEERRALWERFSSSTPQRTTVDYIEWTRHLSLEALTTRKFFLEQHYDLKLLQPLARSGALPLLDERHTVLLDNFMDRLRRVAEAAARARVRLLIDAEQTYLQVAIDHFVRQLQTEYNRDFPVIFNTYQCYLRYSKQHIENDLERAKRLGFWFACKLVRGAYMTSERARAADYGYNDPIFNSIGETHANYDACLDLILGKMHRSNVMAATHNQQSVEFCVRRMNELAIEKGSGGVYFAQLLGMADQLTFTLGANGYRSYKYVPWGPVAEVTPYLTRRVKENGDLMSNSKMEMRLLRKELGRRMFAK